jgi:hypothetical protein
MTTRYRRSLFSGLSIFVRKTTPFESDQQNPEINKF